jgi:cell shape-determining protein MreC
MKKKEFNKLKEQLIELTQKVAELEQDFDNKKEIKLSKESIKDELKLTKIKYLLKKAAKVVSENKYQMMAKKYKL